MIKDKKWHCMIEPKIPIYDEGVIVGYENLLTNKIELI